MFFCSPRTDKIFAGIPKIRLRRSVPKRLVLSSFGMHKESGRVHKKIGRRSWLAIFFIFRDEVIFYRKRVNALKSF